MDIDNSIFVYSTKVIAIPFVWTRLLASYNLQCLINTLIFDIVLLNNI